jgi:hypothetical protein
MKNLNQIMMRKIYFYAIAVVICIGENAIAQENVGIGTRSPNISAVLDIQSADKGLLIPRMSLDQRNGINSPANGLMIYQTNENSGFYFFNGSTWKSFSQNEAKSVATLDINGWALNGNVVGTASKAQATEASFIGTPNNVSINFRIGSDRAGTISRQKQLVALGYKAAEANINAAFSGGYGGLANTAIGFEALKTNTSLGDYNVAVGYFALQLNQVGTDNTGVGRAALQKNTQGSSNMALGSLALNSNIIGNYNIGIGRQALFSTTGNNNVGIGRDAGFAATGSSNVFIGNQAGFSETGSNKLYISNTNSSNPLIKGDFVANNIQVNSRSTGYLAIGDFTTATSSTPGTGGLPLPSNIGLVNGYRLVVQDGILCEKVKVALRATGSADWADYVFEPEYQAKMMTLEEVEKFTKENKHLPNVPTTADVQKNGLDMHETSKMFMEKIEELTLYLIELNKEVKSLKIENELLKKKL